MVEKACNQWPISEISKPTLGNEIANIRLFRYLFSHNRLCITHTKKYVVPCITPVGLLLRNGRTLLGLIVKVLTSGLRVLFEQLGYLDNQVSNVVS